MDRGPCKKQVWNGFSHSTCSRSAKKDGYCTQHHPDTIKAKQEALDRAREARVAAWRKAERVDKARTELLDALRDATEHDLSATIYRLRERWLNEEAS